VSTRHAVARTDEIADGGKKLVKLPAFGKEIEIGVFRLGTEYFAYRNVCPHAGAPVCEGKICGTTLPSDVYKYEYSADKKVLRCPWHGWEFDLKTGAHLVDEKTRLKSYQVESNTEENLEAFAVESDGATVFIIT
jgi:nitrite reductase (NADH) small subunit